MSATYSSTWTLRRAVEARALDRERGRGRLVELGAAAALAAARGRREHRRALVDACHASLRTDRLEQLRRVESWTAADVDHAVAGRASECIAHELAAAQHVARAVHHLELIDDALVEVDLAHVSLGVRPKTRPRSAARPEATFSTSLASGSLRAPLRGAC
jgi:hypothetical protein